MNQLTCFSCLSLIGTTHNYGCTGPHRWPCISVSHSDALRSNLRIYWLLVGWTWLIWFVLMWWLSELLSVWDPLIFHKIRTFQRLFGWTSFGLPLVGAPVAPPLGIVTLPHNLVFPMGVGHAFPVLVVCVGDLLVNFARIRACRGPPSCVHSSIPIWFHITTPLSSPSTLDSVFDGGHWMVRMLFANLFYAVVVDN